ncbi:MAG: M20/M25/M40 family metallo-hydrolase, partial [Hyphomicrobiales bacterium]|nr:M20/M25/M40 family metallo-hydrolase [Hyphomicrobiales bacterium]
MKKILAAVAALVVVLAAVLVVRTTVFGPERQAAAAPAPAVAAPDAPGHLAQAIAIRTVSHQDPAEDDGAAFTAFTDWLAATYPAVHGAMTREILGGHTPLYTWTGSDPALRPVLLTAHYDVVPVDPDSVAAGRWTHPPYAGTLADGFVWGRGSLDDKSAVVALMEAAEVLVKEGFKPRRTLML